MEPRAARSWLHKKLDGAERVGGGLPLGAQTGSSSSPDVLADGSLLHWREKRRLCLLACACGGDGGQDTRRWKGSWVQPAAQPPLSASPACSRPDRAAADSFIAAVGRERSVGRPGPAPSLLTSCLHREKSIEEMGEKSPRKQGSRSRTPSRKILLGLATEGWQENLCR